MLTVKIIISCTFSFTSCYQTAAAQQPLLMNSSVAKEKKGDCDLFWAKKKSL